MEIRPVRIDQGSGSCSGRCAGRQAEMGEDPGNHGGVYDGGDDLQGAATIGPVFQVDIEHPFEQPGPARRAGAAGGGASAWPVRHERGYRTARYPLAVAGIRLRFGLLSASPIAIHREAASSTTCLGTKEVWLHQRPRAVPLPEPAATV